MFLIIIRRGVVEARILRELPTPPLRIETWRSRGRRRPNRRRTSAGNDANISQVGAVCLCVHSEFSARDESFGRVNWSISENWYDITSACDRKSRGYYTSRFSWSWLLKPLLHSHNRSNAKFIFMQQNATVSWSWGTSKYISNTNLTISGICSMMMI